MLKALQLVGGNLPAPPPPAGVEYNSPAQWFPPSVASIDDDLQYGPFDLEGRHLYFHYSPSSGYRACRTRGPTTRCVRAVHTRVPVEAVALLGAKQNEQTPP